jgi:hypothetical protein
VKNQIWKKSIEKRIWKYALERSWSKKRNSVKRKQRMKKWNSTSIWDEKWKLYWLYTLESFSISIFDDPRSEKNRKNQKKSKNRFLFWIIKILSYWMLDNISGRSLDLTPGEAGS